MARRRERLTDKDVERLLAVPIDLPVEQEPAPDDAALAKLMRIARELGLTSCDAAYVEVAHRRWIPLATLDEKLRAACAGASIEVLPGGRA
jgi:predicted nucleic acid-binding protein